MQVITIHSTETEEILGMVTLSPNHRNYLMNHVNFDEFDNEVRKSWTEFNKDNVRNTWLESNDYDCELEIGELTIEDFVDFHNSKSKIEIDWVVGSFIQL